MEEKTQLHGINIAIPSLSEFFIWKTQIILLLDWKEKNITGRTNQLKNLLQRMWFLSTRFSLFHWFTTNCTSLLLSMNSSKFGFLVIFNSTKR